MKTPLPCPFLDAQGSPTVGRVLQPARGPHRPATCGSFPVLALALSASLLSGCPDLAARLGIPMAQGGGTPPPDALVLAPPPPGEGVQLHIGPFDVPQGAEIQRNFYLKLPSDVDVDINRIQVAMREGSHHLNMFKTDKESQPDHAEDDFTQLNFEKYELFAGNQNPAMDWSLPAGVGIRMKARQQLVIQSHYVNATTQKTPGKAEARINLWFAKPGQTMALLGTLFANNRRINIPPRSSVSFSQWFIWKRDVKIAAMTGHFHSRGKRFYVARWNGASETEALYESKNWEEPPFRTFGEGIPIAAGTGIRFTTDFVNNSDLNITFGPRVEVNEHANLFLYFYPADASQSMYFTTTDATEGDPGSQE